MKCKRCKKRAIYKVEGVGSCSGCLSALVAKEIRESGTKDAMVEKA